MKIKYYIRIVNKDVKNLFMYSYEGNNTKRKSYPICLDSFDIKELTEIELNEWLHIGLELGYLKQDDLIPKSCSVKSI